MQILKLLGIKKKENSRYRVTKHKVFKWKDGAWRECKLPQGEYVKI